MTKSIKRNVIVSSLLAICLCVSLIAGATFAIFTSESKVNIAVTSGKVKVAATISDFAAYSPKSISAEEGNAILDDTNTAVDTADENEKIFGNGGTAKLSYAEDGTANIELRNITPGDSVTFKITVTNHSNVKAKYRTLVAKADGSDDVLYGALVFNVGGMTVDGKSAWNELAPVTDDNGAEVATYECGVELPAKVSGEEYMGKTCSIVFAVEAVQGNVDTTEYPAGVTDEIFDAKTDADYNVPGGSTGKAQAIAAYVDSDGEIQYTADIKTALDNGASTVYLRKDTKGRLMALTDFLAQPNRTSDVTRDITIFANGADFEYGELAINTTDEGKNANITIRIYDAKNIRVWGNTPNNGVTQNIILENCTYEGTGIGTNAADGIFFAYGETGAINLTMTNCKVGGSNQGVYFGCDGSLTIKDSVFTECAAGIKVSYKGVGTRTDRIENCVFTKCGCTAEMAGSSDYLADDSAAIKYKTSGNGTITVTLKNNVIDGTIGDKGDMQIADGVTVIE